MIRFLSSLVRHSVRNVSRTGAKRQRRIFVEQLEDRRLLTLVEPFAQFDGVDWTSAAVGGIGRFGSTQSGFSLGSADITVDGVSGVVTQAYLVWHGIDQVSFNGNGNYDNSSIEFNGTVLGGVSVGVNDTATWGSGNSQAYVADVTAHVSGSGTYSVDRLSDKPGHSANGVSLIVIYDDGDSSNDRDLTIMLGNQSRITPFSTDTLTYNGGDIQVQLHAADGQAYPDAGLDFTAFSGEVPLATIQDTTDLLDGNSVASAGNSRATDGDLWDVHNFDLSNGVHAQFAAGADLVLSMDQLAGGTDSLKWVGFLIDQPSDGSFSGNQPPVADNLSFAGSEDGEVSGILSGSDPEGSTLTYAVVQTPQNGQLSVFSPISGRFVYRPNANFNGVDTFTYTVSDGSKTSAVATVTLNISPVNDGPVINPQSFSGTEDTVLNGTIVAFDLDGDQLAFSLVSDPNSGALTLQPDGTFSYTPAADSSGTDTATVSVSDGQASSQAVISFHIAAENDAPVAEDLDVTIDENTANGTVVGMVLASDVDSASLTYTIVGGTGSSAFAIDSATGEVSVADSSRLDFETTTQFTIDVQVSDADLTDVAQVTVDLRDLVDTIDIDVNDDSNTVSLASKTISVAILSTASFDATTAVDFASLTFGATGDEQSLDVHKKRGPKIELIDIDGDGLLDLIARFVTSKTGLDTNSTDAVLKGMLHDGTSFQFSDEIVVEAGKGGGKGRK